MRIRRFVAVVASVLVTSAALAANDFGAFKEQGVAGGTKETRLEDRTHVLYRRTFGITDTGYVVLDVSTLSPNGLKTFKAHLDCRSKRIDTAEDGAQEIAEGTKIYDDICGSIERLGAEIAASKKKRH